MSIEKKHITRNDRKNMRKRYSISGSRRTLETKRKNWKPPKNRPNSTTQKTALQIRIIDIRSRAPSNSDPTVLRSSRQRSQRNARAAWPAVVSTGAGPGAGADPDPEPDPDPCGLAV